MQKEKSRPVCPCVILVLLLYGGIAAFTAYKVRSNNNNFVCLRFRWYGLPTYVLA